MPEQYGSSWELYLATYRGRHISPELQARVGPAEWDHEPYPYLVVIVCVYVVLAVVWEMLNTPRDRNRTAEEKDEEGKVIEPEPFNVVAPAP